MNAAFNRTLGVFRLRLFVARQRMLRGGFRVLLVPTEIAPGLYDHVAVFFRVPSHDGCSGSAGKHLHFLTVQILIRFQPRQDDVTPEALFAVDFSIARRPRRSFLRFRRFPRIHAFRRLLHRAHLARVARVVRPVRHRPCR